MIRRATASDLPTLARLHGACFPQAWEVEAFGRLLASPGTFALLAPADGPHGFVLIRVAADEAEILSLGVEPASRRKGLARKLVTEAAKEAHGEGTATIFLEVAAGNAPAVTLYSRLGFTTAGRRRGYYREPGQPPADALTLKAALPLGNKPGMD